MEYDTNSPSSLRYSKEHRPSTPPMTFKEGTELWENNLRTDPGQFYCEYGGKKPMMHRTHPVEDSDARTWWVGPDGGAWGPGFGPMQTGKIKPLPVRRRPRSNSPGSDQKKRTREGHAEVWQPVPLPSLKDITAPTPLPPPLPRVNLGYDMRTVRKQVEDLQEEVEQRLDFKEKLYEQNFDIWNQLNMLEENNEANSEAAKIFLGKLIYEIRRLEAELEQCREIVVSAEETSQNLLECEREQKHLGLRKSQALKNLESLERENITRQNENSALQEELQSQSKALQDAERDLYDAIFLKKSDKAEELADMVLCKTVWRRRKALRLLVLATWRSRNLRALSQKAKLVHVWTILERVVKAWKRYAVLEKVRRVALWRRREEHLSVVFLRWRIFAAVSAQAKVLAERRRKSAVFRAWQRYSWEQLTAKLHASIAYALQQKCFLRRHMLAWKNISCFGSPDDEEIKEKMRIATFYHLWKLFSYWSNQTKSSVFNKNNQVAFFLEKQRHRLLKSILEAWWAVVAVEIHRNMSLKLKAMKVLQKFTQERFLSRTKEEAGFLYWARKQLKSALGFLLEKTEYARQNEPGFNAEFNPHTCLQFAQDHWATCCVSRGIRAWLHFVDAQNQAKGVERAACRALAYHRARKFLSRLKKIHHSKICLRQKKRHLRLSRAFQALQLHTRLLQKRKGSTIVMHAALKRILFKMQRKAFVCWRCKLASRTTSEQAEEFVIQRRKTKLTRSYWCKWMLAWGRAGQNKVGQLQQEVGRIKSKLEKEHDRHRTKEESKGKLAEVVRNLSIDVKSLQEQVQDRATELKQLKQEAVLLRNNEVKASEELERKQHNLQVLQAEYERLSEIEAAALERQVKAEAQKAQRHHQEQELLQAMHSVEAQLQEEVANAESLSQQAIDQLEKSRDRDARTLEEATKVSEKCKDAVKKKEQAIKDLERECILINEQLSFKRKEYQNLASKTKEKTEDIDRQIRRSEGQHSILQLKLNQVEARAREAEGMVREKEREAAILREEIRRMKAEREVLENLRKPGKSFPEYLSATEEEQSLQNGDRSISSRSSDISKINLGNAVKLVGSLQKHLCDANEMEQRWTHSQIPKSDTENFRQQKGQIKFDRNVDTGTGFHQQNIAKTAYEQMDHPDNMSSCSEGPKLYESLQNSIEQLQQRILSRLNTNHS